jgi:transcriptional regulator with XRE-family HTH domain
MITNERQHRITAAETKRFEHAIARAEHDRPAPDVDPRLHEAMIAGMRSQLNDLSDELREYEALRDGKIKGRVLDSLLALPDALIEARIAGRLTQKELGHKLGIPEQQVQRYEQLRYRGVGIERLQEVAEALGIKLRKTIKYNVRGPRRRRRLTTADGARAVARSSDRSTASSVKGGKQMAGRKTGKAAASAAGKTLASHSASRSAKKAAASDLAERGNQKVTSKKAASAAGRTLRSKSASKTAREAAASDLSQARKTKR